MAEAKGEEFVPYVILQGTVRDDFGDYVPEVNIIYTSKVLTPDGDIAFQDDPEASALTESIPEEFTETGITNSEGEFKLYILSQYFVPDSVTVYFRPPQETTLGDKQINKISPENANQVGPIAEIVPIEKLEEFMPDAQEEIKASKYTIYELGDIKLSGFTYAFEELQRSIRDKINTVETKIIDLANKFKLPTEEQLIKLFQERKEWLKENLVPIVITLFNAFGPSIVQALQSGASKAILGKLKSCPTEAELKIIIAKRNTLVKQLNIIYSIVKILRILGVSTTVITAALKVGLASYNATPFPIPPAADTAKGALEKRLELYGILATGLTTVTSMIGYILGLIIDYLNKLDFLIKECSQEQDIPFEALNEELNNLADPVLIKQMQDNEIVYKGFTLKVELTPITSGKYQSRVGIAYDASNTPVLKTPSSFTSNPELLLQQLQLVIDTQDLKAI